jgi:mRNA interferase RelE/StbE
VYHVSLSDEAKTFFENASAKLQKSLDRCFDQLKVNPYVHPNIKELKGKLAGYYRYRVGRYRVIYQIYAPKNQVFVSIIAHRSGVYG